MRAFTTFRGHYQISRANQLKFLKKAPKFVQRHFTKKFTENAEKLVYVHSNVNLLNRTFEIKHG